MRKKIIGLVIVSLVCSGFLMVDKPQPAAAYTKAELDKINQQIKEYQKKKEAAQAKAAAAKQKKKDYEKNIAKYGNEVDRLQADIVETGTQLQALQSNITTTEIKLDKAQTKLTKAMDRVQKRDKKLKARLRLMYTNGSVSYLDVLFKSASFSDFFDRLNALQALVGQDRKLLDANRNDMAIISKEHRNIEDMFTSLNSGYKKVARLRSTMQSQEAYKEEQIGKLKKQVTELEELTAREEAEAVKYAKQEAKLIAQKQQIENTYTGGKLGYPLLAYYPITSEFGQRIDPITNKPGAMHNGMDFGAPGGTTIVAAEAGTVVTSGWVNGYGETVVISHGNIWTWYCHMQTGSRVVSAGEKVARGQKVGRVGSTGRSTGNHLHFGVYDSVRDKWVNPRPYLNL